MVLAGLDVFRTSPTTSQVLASSIGVDMAGVVGAVEEVEKVDVKKRQVGGEEDGKRETSREM